MKRFPKTDRLRIKVKVWEIFLFLDRSTHRFPRVLFTQNKINHLALTTGSRTITSDRIVYNNSSLSFTFQQVVMISLDRNY